MRPERTLVFIAPGHPAPGFDAVYRSWLDLFASGGVAADRRVHLERDATVALAKARAFWMSVDAVLFAFSPTLDDFDLFTRHVAALTVNGVPRRRILPVLWGDGIRHGVTLASIRSAYPDAAAVPWDPALAMLAAFRGRSIGSLAPRSSLQKALIDLSQRAHALFACGVDPADTMVRAESLAETVVERIWRMTGSEQNDEVQLESLVDAEVNRFCAVHAPPLPPPVVDEVRALVHHQVKGLGPLEPLFQDAAISEIMINGGQNVFVERSGRMERVSGLSLQEAHLHRIIDRMLRQAGRRADTASPLCDLRLDDGSRVNIVLPPLSVTGPLVTIRRFRSAFLTMEDLLRVGSLRHEQMTHLKRAVLTRKNIVVAGNAGSGKTTLLNILSHFIAPHERIITLEDAAELKLQQQHVVRMETRKKNVEGHGDVTMQDLVINALRMRPDRLIVGECRGTEVVPMLQAMNTGHDGSMTSLHANSAEDALRRLEAMALMGAPHWPLDVIRQQIASAIDVIVYVRRVGVERKVMQICDLKQDGNDLTLVPSREPCSV